MYVLAVVALGIAALISVGAAFIYRRNLLLELFAVIGIVAGGHVAVWVIMTILAGGYGVTDAVLATSLWGPSVSAVLLFHRLGRVRKFERTRLG